MEFDSQIHDSTQHVVRQHYSIDTDVLWDQCVLSVQVLEAVCVCVCARMREKIFIRTVKPKHTNYSTIINTQFLWCFYAVETCLFVRPFSTLK